MNTNAAKERALARVEAHPEWCAGCAHYGGYCGMCNCSSFFVLDWEAIEKKYLQEEEGEG
jgi:hypothetical protein